MKVKWKRGNEGFCDSHDGKWSITPQYWGNVNPVGYSLWYYPHGQDTRGPGVQVLYRADTHKECKAYVEELETYPTVPDEKAPR